MAGGPTLDVERTYRDHGHVVLRRARRLLGNDADAAEVVQEVFLSLVDRPEQFAGYSAITTFLYAMTTNACLTRLRNHRRRRELADHELGGRRQGVEPSTEAALDAARLLDSLPPRLAQVATYFYYDQMTHEEIARVLGVSRRQVGNLVARVQQEARKYARVA